MTVSIRAASRIQATEFDATSDARIKKVIGPSDPERALRTVNRLKITEYEYVDKVEHGDGRRTGVLAQEAKDVVPDAIRSSRGFVPVLFAMAEMVRHDAVRAELTVTLARPHGLAVGEVVRAVGERGRMERAVVAILDGTTFVLGGVEMPETELFVWGKEVDDFHSVSYEDLFATGLAAIQELSRRSESLLRDNEELRRRLERIERAVKVPADVAASR